jgi:hypothetical protein
MSARFLMGLLVGVVLSFSTTAGAAEPPASDLPRPRELPALTVLPAAPVMPSFYRPSHYEVWQYYDVGQQGRWVPRVVYAPHGAYYLSNGAPYPWATNYPRYWQPAIMGTPYRSAE